MLFRKKQKHYFLSDKIKGTLCLYITDQQYTLDNIVNIANRTTVQQNASVYLFVGFYVF